MVWFAFGRVTEQSGNLRIALHADPTIVAPLLAASLLVVQAQRQGR
jgi:hypothetical protein